VRVDSLTDSSDAWLPIPAELQWSHHLNFVEIAIPLSWLTDPTAIYVCGAIIRNADNDALYDFSPDQDGTGHVFKIENFWGFPLIAGIQPNFAGHINSFPTFTMTNGDYFVNYLWSSNDVPDANATIYIRNQVSMESTINVKNLMFLDGGSGGG
jgi:hypothetical protein